MTKKNLRYVLSRRKYIFVIFLFYDKIIKVYTTLRVHRKDERIYNSSR